MTKREDRARALLLDVLSANGSDRKLAAILAFADEVRADRRPARGAEGE
jgi:hypothetical protein